MISRLIGYIQRVQQARVARELDAIPDWRLNNLGITREELNGMIRNSIERAD